MLILVFSIITYLYYPFIQDYSTTPKWIGLGTICLIFLFIKSKQKVYLTWPIVLWLLFVFQYLFNSFRSYNFWDATFHSIPLVLAPLIVSLLLKISVNKDDVHRNAGFWLGIILLPLIVFNLIEIFNLIISGNYSHQSTYGFRYTFGHRNQFSHFLTLSIPIIFISFLKQNKKWQKIFLVVVMVSIILTIILLLNRTSIIVILGIYPLLGIAYWISEKWRKIRKRVIIIGSISLVSLFTIALLERSLISGAKSIFETNYGSGNERIRIWKNSWKLIKEEPVFGHGSGDWKIEILRFPLDFTQAENGMVFFQRAHNDLIQVATENGMLGLIILLIFFIVSFVTIVKSPIPKSRKYSILGGLLGFLLIANLSFPFEKLELTLLLFIFLMPSISSPKPIFKISNSFSTTLLSLITSLVLVLSFIKLSNEKKYSLFKATNDIEYLNKLNNFYTIDPVSTPIKWHSGNHFFEKQNFSKAINEYQLALKNNPYHIHLLNNLASSYVKTEQYDSATFYYNVVVSINSTFTETRMNLASLSFNSGDIDGALGHILNVKISDEPESYITYIATIGQAKCRWLVDLYDEPSFEQFLINNDKNANLFYQISLRCRATSASFEDELRLYFQNLQ